MQITLVEASARDAASFERFQPQHALRVSDKTLDAGNAREFADAEILSCFIYSQLGAAALAQLPRLKLIATRSTGFDHIDLGYCRAHGIAVANVPSYGENTVAEHVFALLLALSHRLPEAVRRAREGLFSPQGLEGFDLAGKTFGVIGTGAIGRHALRIAKGFGMQTVASDIREDAALAAELGFRYVPLAALLERADVVSLHVPATPATHNMIDAAALARMKRGAVLINTARGSLIETGALVAALKSGHLAGAGLDVLPEEPLIREEAELIAGGRADAQDLRQLLANHVLLNMANVVVTPHSAFNTREAILRIAETTAANVDAFLLGRPQNLVG